MAGGLALLISKSPMSKDGKDKDMKKMMDEPEAEDNPAEEKKEAGLEDEYLDDAFSALKSDDKEAFREALKSAFQACYDKQYGSKE